MSKQSFINFLINKWYIPLVVVGVSVGTVVTATTNTSKEVTLTELWDQGGNPSHSMHQPLQAGGPEIQGAHLFDPPLDQFIAKKLSNNISPSGLLMPKGSEEIKPTRISREADEFNQMVDQQYFFKYAQHMKLVGSNADSMRKGTSGKGDIWVSSRIAKVHPIQNVNNDSSQCADIMFRVTHFEVPRQTYVGGEDELVTFWQDYKKTVCHQQAQS